MLNLSYQVIKDFWFVLSEMAPYLILGFFIAGLLAVLIKPETVERNLGGKGRWNSFISSFKATIFGIPLPLCSCGVIPVAASLRRHGANRGATTAFLISTPQTGVDSIAVTYSLMGLVFAIYRPLVALVSGIAGGTIVGLLVPDVDNDRAPAPVCNNACCSPESGGKKLNRIFHYGFVELPQDIGKALLFGLLIAGLITALLPEDFFAQYLGTGFFPMLVMLIGGIPFYVCATGSVPMAIALIAKGLSPGAALVFLMTGPATNMATIMTIWKVMGRKTAIIYLLVVALAALGFGLLLDYGFQHLFPAYTPQVKWHHIHHSEIGYMFYLKSLAAVALLGVLGFALFTRGHAHDHGEHAHGEGELCAHEAHSAGREEKPMTITFEIKGMTCNHCVNAVTRALKEVGGVESVSVDLKTGTAVLEGSGVDKSRAMQAVEALGYSIAEKANKE